MRILGRLAGLVAALAFLGCGRFGKPDGIVLATTPEIAGNGVAATLAEQFTKETHVPVNVLVTEEGLLVELARKGSIDAVITTSPSLQKALQRSGHATLTNRFAFNDYLLVGPKRDPARAMTASSAVESIRRIAGRDEPFCSPVDVPDLRERETALWHAAHVPPQNDRRYRLCSGTAQSVLREASRLLTYTLTDRGTFEGVPHPGLTPLRRKTPLLHKDYNISLIGRGREPAKNGEWFVQWVMSFRGREIIESFRSEDGGRLFTNGV